MKKLKNSFKKSWHKLKFLDKTKSRYFFITSFICAFCLFTATTYSFFAISKNLNTALISIAKLNYELKSSNANFANNQVVVNAGETIYLDLTLKSLNAESTKYALNNITNNESVKVYYSENLKNNMSGEIGATGSEIPLRIVLVNSASNPVTVELEIRGGYLQNNVSSNITEGYYENDVTVRTLLTNEDMQNTTLTNNFPAETEDYAYLKTICSTPNVTARWNSADWNLELDNIEERTSCDVYFKKIKDDVEIYLAEDDNGQITYKDNIPNDGTYSYKNATCNNETTPTWDNTTWQLNLSNAQEKTVCTVYFTKN